MPRTGLRVGPDLAIEIDNLKSSYIPGDTITGRVTRRTQIAKADSWICLNLYGQSKTKLVDRGGEVSTTYRARYNFFDSAPQMLHEGPVHVPPDGQPGAWPFSVTIPTCISAAAVMEGNERAIERGDTFLPVNHDTVSMHKLPPVFFGKPNSALSDHWYGYVEYYLEAQLGLAKSSKDNEAVVRDYATFPLFIRSPSTPKPTTNFRLATKDLFCSRTAYALVPGLEEMTLKKRTRQLFRSSKCPRFAYTLEMQYPTVLQLANHNPIPLLVRALPNEVGTSPDVAVIPQKVTLLEVEMELVEKTEIIFTGTFSPHKRESHERHFFGLHEIIKGLPSEVIIPSGPDSEPLDVGSLLQIRLGTHGVTAVNPRSDKTMKLDFPCPPAPSFQTYNMRHTHVLKCNLVVSVAGGKERVFTEEPVTVLGMSEVQASRGLAELGEGGMEGTYNAMLAAQGIGLGVATGLGLVSFIGS